MENPHIFSMQEKWINLSRKELKHIFNDLIEGIKDRNYIKYEYDDDEILHGTLMVVRPV